MRAEGKWGRFRLPGALLLVALLVGMPHYALAHAVLVSSAPKASSTIEGPVTEIVLRYNARIDAARSSLTLVAPDSKQRVLSIEKQAEPNVLQTKASDLVKGSYALRWQVLASDGHITRGVVSFAVR